MSTIVIVNETGVVHLSNECPAFIIEKYSLVCIFWPSVIFKIIQVSLENVLTMYAFLWFPTRPIFIKAKSWPIVNYWIVFFDPFVFFILLNGPGGGTFSCVIFKDLLLVSP